MAKQNSAIFMPVIPFDRESATPLHRQLYESYKQAILKKQLRSGAKLPSTRELAKELKISRNTVMTAFEQLLAEGFLEGKTGSGTYVSSQLPEEIYQSIPVEKKIKKNASPSVFSKNSDCLINQWRGVFLDGLGAFRASVPALDQFPWSIWARIISNCVRRQTREQLAYSSPSGLKPFRETIAAYLRTSRNVRCEAEQIIIVSGSQQALCLISQVLSNPLDSIWIEDPGYPGARDAFLLNGLRLCPVPVDSEGLLVQTGKRTFPEARLAYVTPSNQYPLGVTLSLNRRLELLEWAASSDSWIIEDDFNSEYRYVSRPLSSLQGLSNQEQVIYVGTFSKVLFPSVRVGYMVVPPNLVERFAIVREATDIFPPALPQMVLTEFINEGHFARHIRKMRAVYSERLDQLKKCVEQEMGERAYIETAESGMHIVLFTRAEIDDVAFSKEAASRGIVAMPLSPCYLGKPKRSGLILGFAGSDADQIRKGVKILSKTYSNFDSDK